ncbi:MAG: NAD(P)-dependent alcohol dehydrogenase [Candidatus Cloacimonetes bacterium]|nr:NAD(P)-dependent alcohol dehydrogenase [Candidatus Cloacimonadota bacterium]
MKIAINEQFGDVEKIKIIETELPKLSTDEVLIKVKSAGLNPKDVLIRKGKFKLLIGRRFPQPIGFDFSGIIEDPNKSSYKKGNKVFGMINGWRGRCCAEYVNVKEGELYKMPENISFEEAAGIPLAGQTSLQAIRDIGNLSQGKKILINGASGGVGTLAIQIAKEIGGEVTTISSSKNLEFCKSLGADNTISYEEKNILELDTKFDIIYDVFGNLSFRKVVSILTSKGRYITTVPKPAIFKEQFFNLFRRRKAKMIYVKSNKKYLKWFNEKISARRIKPVIDKIFDFSEIKAAQKHIESKRAKGKVILKMNTTPNKA